MNKSRDLTEHIEALKKELDRNRSLLDEKTLEYQKLESFMPQHRTPLSTRIPYEKDPPARVIPRNGNAVDPNPNPYPYSRPDRAPVRYTDPNNIMLNQHIHHEPSPARPDYFIRIQTPTLPPSVIVHPNVPPGSPAMAPGSPSMPPGPPGMYSKDIPKHPEPLRYKQNDNFGYK